MSAINRLSHDLWGEIASYMLEPTYLRTDQHESCVRINSPQYDLNTLLITNKKIRKIVQSFLKQIKNDIVYKIFVPALNARTITCEPSVELDTLELDTFGHDIRFSTFFHRLQEERSGDELTRLEFETLAILLPQNPGLSEISIYNRKLRQQMDLFLVHLARNHTITRLFLSRNNISDQGAAQLAAVVAKHPTLHTLHLANPDQERWFAWRNSEGQAILRRTQFNQIGDEGALALVQATRAKPNFRLDLQGNPISDECKARLKVLMPSIKL